MEGMEEPSARICIIGIDGATWDNILPLVGEGRLPVLAGLIDSGSSGVLESTFPCVTPPAWGSFLTGASPARHGVLDFTRRLDSDLFSFVTAEDLAVPKIWSVLGHMGRRSVFVGVPFTHPPERIHGAIVPGPPVPPGPLATHPPELSRRIAERFPRYRAEIPRARGEAYLAAAAAAAKERRDLALELMESEEWDLFMVTFIGLDRLQHVLWHRPEIPARYLARLDSLLGDILEGLDEKTYVLLMSDHGFTSVRTRFFPNQWLADAGYLKARFLDPGKPWKGRFLSPTPRRPGAPGKAYGWRGLARRLPGLKRMRWVIDLERTKAFASFGHLTGVFVNLRGRYEQGIVEPGNEYENLRDALIADLEALREPGRYAPLFRRIGRREDLFDGPAVERMPDVIMEVSDPAVRLRSNVGLRRPFLPFGKKKKSYHAPEGIFCLKGPGIRGGARIDGTAIQDLAPLVLFLLGLPRLDSMDGRIPLALLDEKLLGKKELPLLPAAGIAPPRRSAAALPAERERIIADLERLGYF